MINILFAIDKTDIDPTIVNAIKLSDKLDYNVIAKKTGTLLVDLIVYDESVLPKLKAALGGVVTIIGVWDDEGVQIGQTKTITYDASGNPVITITGTPKYPFKTTQYKTFISSGKNNHAWAGWAMRPLI